LIQKVFKESFTEQKKMMIKNESHSTTKV